MLSTKEQDNERVSRVLDTAALYKARFDKLPTISGLALHDPDLGDRIIEALHSAIEDDEPFASDEDWYEAIGVEPPPVDAKV